MKHREYDRRKCPTRALRPDSQCDRPVMFQRSSRIRGKYTVRNESYFIWYFILLTCGTYIDDEVYTSEYTASKSNR